MSLYRLAFVASLSATVLAGCAVGPNYREPEIATAEQWHSLPSQGVHDEGADAPSLAAWWTALGDEQLTSLIDRAVQGSKTVQQAIARVKEARARRGAAIAPLFPSFGASASKSRVTNDFNASGNNGFGGSNGSNSSFGSDADVYSAGLDASWEIDLFGGR